MLLLNRIAGARRLVPRWWNSLAPTAMLQSTLPLRRVLAALGVLLAFGLGAALPTCAAADPAQPNDGAQVLQSFERTAQGSDQPDAADQTRRWVMFALGAPLLILLLITGSLGIAMGVYGKPVYLPHMICAGLSITLAIVHAIVGIVWFRPF
jgi:hypothetical protein